MNSRTDQKWGHSYYLHSQLLASFCVRPVYHSKYSSLNLILSFGSFVKMVSDSCWPKQT